MSSIFKATASRTTKKVRVKKTRKLGKWKTGYGGKLTESYAKKRKKKMKQARRSRSRNHK